MSCLCNELRKTARSVTEEYERALAPVGLRLNQYSVLSNISKRGTAQVTELANALELDQTSATRSIALLEQMGLVERVEHSDPRVKLLKLTKQGKKRLEAALPLWKKVQSKMQAKVSEQEWILIADALQKLRASA